MPPALPASICCLLDSLAVGGVGRQWTHLLGRHVEKGGRAAIAAPPGPLAPAVRSAGIELIEVDWRVAHPYAMDGLWHLLGAYDAAVVQWEPDVVAALRPALAACGRGALALHSAPEAAVRWFGPKRFASMRRAVAQAAADPRAAALVCGELHRRRVADVCAVPAAALDILPACIPTDPIAFDPAPLGGGGEVLALVRLSREKSAVVELAVELVGAAGRAGGGWRLTVAGDGPLREWTLRLCRRRLPAGTWRVERPPADPIRRLREADLVVAQGLTTLEAAAVGRPVVVAPGTEGAAGASLSPNSYDRAARDPFGQPERSEDAARLLAEAQAVDEGQLTALRALVERHNGLDAGLAALAAALALPQPAGKGSRPACQGPGG